MKERLIKHHISFKNAFAGLYYALKSQPNFQVHGIISFIVIVTGIVFHITSIEMIILILTIVIGLSVEMVNTAIESVTDLVTQEWRQEAKIAKDVSAGMMLLTAIGTSIVGTIIFLPYIISFFVR